MRSKPIWFVGDMHLGRRAASLPSTLSDFGVERSKLDPHAAWRRLVAHVAQDGAEALVLAGDVIDSDAARFEARGIFEDGVAQLRAAGVRVCAVAGNHDVEALPKLARVVDGFELLGVGGQWEEVEFEALSVLAWSYPETRVRHSPLEGLPDAFRARPSAKRRIGLVHADLDRAPSVYAPVKSAELRAVDVDAWLLGHVHEPSVRAGALTAEAPALLGYLGSLSPLHRGERGARSAWRVHSDAGTLHFEAHDFAGLRFESIELDLAARQASGSEKSLDLQDEIAKACLAHAARIVDGEHSSLELLIFDVVVRARSEPGGGALRAEVDAIADGGMCLRAPQGVVVHVDRVHCHVLPSVDLDALARGADAVAVLARELLSLEAERSALRSPLLRDFEARAHRLARDARFRDLQKNPASSEADLDRFLRVGYRVLEHMLS